MKDRAMTVPASLESRASSRDMAMLRPSCASYASCECFYLTPHSFANRTTPLFTLNHKQHNTASSSSIDINPVQSPIELLQ